jgi:hypothetical protein
MVSDKNIILFGNKLFEERSINLIESFDRLPDKYTFYYYTVGFDACINRSNVIQKRIEEVPDIPIPYLYKVLVLQDALKIVDHFVYFDSDMLVSKHFNYDWVLSSVDQYPKCPNINGWDDPSVWYTRNGVRFDYTFYQFLNEYKGVHKTQPWSVACLLAANKSCKDFINEWVEFSMDKTVWEIPKTHPEVPAAVFIGDENMYNVLLWKYGCTDYYYKHIVLEPKYPETIYELEMSTLCNVQMEPNTISTYCGDSNIICAYHQLEDVSLRREILRILNELEK